MGYCYITLHKLVTITGYCYITLHKLVTITGYCYITLQKLLVTCHVTLHMLSPGTRNIAWTLPCNSLAVDRSIAWDIIWILLCHFPYIFLIQSEVLKRMIELQY